MALQGIVHTSHLTIKRHLNEGDVAVDATVGAGFDTRMMARAVGSSGKVYGFDVQDEALETAGKALADDNLSDRVVLFRAGHERMREFLPQDILGRVKAFAFNLGYLPCGSDRSVTTNAETSLTAIRTAMEIMHPKGIISVAVYGGHEQGEREKRILREWAAGIPYTDFRIAGYEFINKSVNQESLLFIEKV